MPFLALDTLRIRRRWRFQQSRLWREVCFARVVMRRFWARALIMAAILLAGATTFLLCQPERNFTLLKATFFAWSLVFGQPPEEFPEHPALQALYFVMPILGLTVIIEGIVDFSMLLRERQRAHRSWSVTMAQSLSNHVIIVGLGRLGISVYTLLRKLGEPVAVIDRNPENQFLEQLRRDGTPFIIGDARRDELLEQLNIRAARSIIPATNDDLANLEIALDARRFNPAIRVVLRMFDQNLANKVRDGFNIQTAMSQAALSAPRFATAALERNIAGSFVCGDRLVIMLRWVVRERGPLVDQSLGQLARENSIAIAEHRPLHGEPRLFPPPDVRLRVGDELLVQAPYEALDDLRRFVGPTP